MDIPKDIRFYASIVIAVSGEIKEFVLMLKIHLSCPNHKRYDPARDHEAGIKGACKFCSAMFKLYMEALGLIRKVTEDL